MHCHLDGRDRCSTGNECDWWVIDLVVHPDLELVIRSGLRDVVRGSILVHDVEPHAVAHAGRVGQPLLRRGGCARLLHRNRTLRLVLLPVVEFKGFKGFKSVNMSALEFKGVQRSSNEFIGMNICMSSSAVQVYKSRQRTSSYAAKRGGFAVPNLSWLQSSGSVAFTIIRLYFSGICLSTVRDIVGVTRDVGFSPVNWNISKSSKQLKSVL